jgi:predicted Zn-dependent peptidase
MNPIRVPEPMRFELPNGLVVYLVQDHELPTIDVRVLIRVGSRWEPTEKAGLASIVGTVLRTGGTPTRDGDALDEELDRLGAIVETGIDMDSGQASVSVLKEDFDRGLEILADLLQHPAFPEKKIELAKIAERDGIARRNDEPTSIAYREFGRLLYGKDSPYARQTEYDTINSITRADLVAFHREFFQPENVIVGVWGDFQAGEMRAKIEKVLGGWARGGRPKPLAPPVDPTARQRAGIYSINKEDVNQSSVLLGHLGGQRNDPDYYALTIMGRILGDGFSSRLFSNVRSQQGLAYSVHATWSAGWDWPGLFMASGGTKSETTIKFIQAIKHEIVRMTEAEPSDQELATTKDAILKGFAFEFDSTAKIVRRLLAYEYFGYPRDYLQRFRENIEKVTQADVLRVAKQYLRPDGLAILVLGKEQDFDQAVSTLGAVTPVDITIPPPKTETPAPSTPGAADQARKLLTATREAMGGAVLRALTNHVATLELRLSTPQGDLAMKMEATIVPGIRLLSKLTGPFGELTQGFDGQTAWRRTPNGVEELSGSGREELLSSLYRDTVWLVRDFDAPGVSIQALGAAQVDGKPVENVVISDPTHDVRVTFALDPVTHLPVKKSYRALFMGSPSELEETFAEYREVGGVKAPSKTRVALNGQNFGEVNLTEFKANVQLEEGMFKKPQ